MATNTKIMSISCPTSNGMSGGPIIMETNNGSKVVGILHGGPCGTTHYKIMVTIFETIDGININALFKLLKKIEKQIKSIESSGAQICYELYRFREEIVNCMKIIQNGVNLSHFSNSKIIEQLLYLYSKVLLIEAESGRNINYNLGLTLEMFRNDITA